MPHPNVFPCFPMLTRLHEFLRNVHDMCTLIDDFLVTYRNNFQFGLTQIYCHLTENDGPCYWSIQDQFVGVNLNSSAAVSRLNQPHVLNFPTPPRSHVMVGKIRGYMVQMVVMTVVGRHNFLLSMPSFPIPSGELPFSAAQNAQIYMFFQPFLFLVIVKS